MPCINPPGIHVEEWGEGQGDNILDLNENIQNINEDAQDMIK